MFYDDEMQNSLRLLLRRRFTINVLKVLAGILGLSFVLGSGALAEILEGEPGTSLNPKNNVPENIQRSDPYLYGDDFSTGSGPGSRSGELTGLKHEKPVKEDLEELELENMEKSKEEIFSHNSENP